MDILAVLTDTPKNMECICQESSLTRDKVLEQIKFLRDEVNVNVIETEKGFYIPHYRINK